MHIIDYQGGVSVNLEKKAKNIKKHSLYLNINFIFECKMRFTHLIITELLTFKFIIMKKGLQLFCSLLLVCLATNKANSQDFDYNMTYGLKNASDIGNDVTKKASSNIKLGRVEYPASSGSYVIGATGGENPGVKEGVLQNGINMYMPKDAANQFAPKDDTAPHGYVRMNGNAKYFMIIEKQPTSANDVTGIVQLSLLVGGSSTATTTGTAGEIEVKYGTLPPDTTGKGWDEDTKLLYFSVWENSLKTLNTKDFGGGIAPPPGNASNFTITNSTNPFAEDPDAIVPTRYIRLTSKASGSTTKLFRVAASTKAFVLPLNLLSFTAKADAFGKSVNLNWKTSNEVNTKEFSIERRTDNTDFVAIGTKASKNVSGVHNYSFADNNTVSGNVYYRLKQIDNDGNFAYSDVVSVNLAGQTSLSVYPNPTSDVLNLTHASATNGSVKVFSLGGQSLIEQSLANGATSTSINVSNLVKGAYLVVVNNAGVQSSVKFVKN